MQQRGDRFGFISTVFHRDRTDSQNMGDIRNFSLFAQLPAVDSRRVEQRFPKLGREFHLLTFKIRRNFGNWRTRPRSRRQWSEWDERYRSVRTEWHLAAREPER